LFENSNWKIQKFWSAWGGSSFGLWKFKIDGNEGSWGFVIWVYVSSAISKKSVEKASGSFWIVCGVTMRFWQSQNRIFWLAGKIKNYPSMGGKECVNAK
jgi:hypothetical protein